MATVTRTQLRRRSSGALGNMLIATATANGTTTTLIDTITLKISDNGLVGREAYFYSGTALNIGLKRTISTSNNAAGSITFPAVTSTVAGDVVEIHNTRASGWVVQEIHDEIDSVLREASDSMPKYTRSNVVAVFNKAAPTVTIPATFRGIYALHWLDADGLYHEIPAASEPSQEGWWVNRGQSELIVNGSYRNTIDTYVVRIYGTEEYAALSTDASTTTCNEEWLVNQVCANLLMRGSERVSDNSRMTKADWFQKKADQRRDLLVQVPPPNFVLV